MSTNQKFNDAKERLVITAQRIAGNYLLAKYGSAHLVNEPVVELTHTQDERTAAYSFSGKITCYADGLLNQVGVNMTINENDIEVTSEDVQSNVTNALNANESNRDTFVAALDGFRLTDDGSTYLKVSHVDASESVLGIVGKDEYKSSKDKSALLQGILKDAAVSPKVEFTGEFKEPTFEKVASEPVVATKKEAALIEEKQPESKKSSWLTAELFAEASKCEECDKAEANDATGHCDNCQKKVMDEYAEEHEASLKTVAIKEDMPLARAADHLVQSAQSEEQSSLEAQLKVEHEAANELVSLLQGMGYGSAKAVEITSSAEGIDIMTAVDHNGSVKAVSIPVTVKEGKYTLPKKALISTLISKGLDVQAKLAEQFDLELLEKLAAIDERMAYETSEVNAILSEKPVEKTANEGKNTMFEGDTDTLTVQKHLLPNHENLNVGDKISDGSDQWEIVNQGGQQNSKGEGDSSLWTMKKCQSPARSDEEPKNKMPI